MTRELRLIFLFPLVWRPEKENFARRFARLSEHASGAIFALSGARQRGTRVGRFEFYSEPYGGSAISRFLSRLKLQTWLPWRRFRRRGPVDAVIVYDPYGSGVNGILLKAVLRTRLIVELNGDHHEVRPASNPLKNWIMDRILHWTLARADAVKVVNSSLERFVRKHYPGKPVYRFLDFVADGYFAALESSQGSYFLSVGHPFEFKGVGELIAAFHGVAARHPDIGLRIMGHCPEEEMRRYRELARGDERIGFVPAGWIEDVAEQMRGCLALVVASHFDAAPRVVFEAMACRKPVIATRTNGGMDYVEPEKTGLLCRIGDADDLAAQLERLAADRELARRLGEEGFRRLETDYCEARYTERFLSMLSEVTGRDAKG